MSNPVNGYNFHPEEQNTIAPPSPREDYPQSSNRGCRERLSRPPIKQFPCTATRSLISYYLYILKLAEIRVRSSRTRFRFREGLILSLFFFFFFSCLGPYHFHDRLYFHPTTPVRGSSFVTGSRAFCRISLPFPRIFHTAMHSKVTLCPILYL